MTQTITLPFGKLMVYLGSVPPIGGLERTHNGSWMDKRRTSPAGGCRTSIGFAKALGFVRILRTWGSFARLSACLVLLTGGTIILAPASSEVQSGDVARLIRLYQEDASELTDLSRDGQFMLTLGSRERTCSDNASRCRQPVLAVYKTRTGERLGKTTGREGSWFSAAAFGQTHTVTAVELHPSMGVTRLTWDPLSHTEERTPMDTPSEFRPSCVLADGSLLGVLGPTRTERARVAVVRRDAVREPAQPSPYFQRDLNCRGWTHERSVLLESADRDPALHWISIDSEPPISCRKFSEQVFNYAISPDGSLIAVVTGNGEFDSFDDDVMGPRHTASVQVLSRRTCEVLRSFELKISRAAQIESTAARTKEQILGQCPPTLGIRSDARRFSGQYETWSGLRHSYGRDL